MVIDPYPSLPGAQFRPAAEQGDAAQAADGLQIGFALLDEGGKICRCSEAFARSFGRSSPEKITGLELSALHPALSEYPLLNPTPKKPLPAGLIVRFVLPSQAGDEHGWRLMAAPLQDFDAGQLVVLAPDPVPGPAPCGLERFEPVEGQETAPEKALSRLWQDSLKAALRFNETILSAVSEGIVILDDHFEIRMATPTAEAMFDAEPGELLGKELWSYLI
jgi:PAS domain-containing protein